MRLYRTPVWMLGARNRGHNMNLTEGGDTLPSQRIQKSPKLNCQSRSQVRVECHKKQSFFFLYAMANTKPIT